MGHKLPQAAEGRGRVLRIREPEVPGDHLRPGLLLVLVLLVLVLVLRLGVRVLLHVGRHHGLLEQRGLVVQLDVVRVRHVLRQLGGGHHRELHRVHAVQAQVVQALQVQLKEVRARPLDHELHLAHRLPPLARDARHAHDLPLPRGQQRVPGLPPGQRVRRRVHGRALAPLGHITPRERHLAGHQVPLRDLLLVLHKHLHRRLQVRQDLAHRQALLALLRRQLGQPGLLRILLGQKGGQVLLGHAALGGHDGLDALGPQVRQLREGRVPVEQALGQVLRELEHAHGRAHPLVRGRQVQQRVDQLGRPRQHPARVLPQRRRHLNVKEVGVDHSVPVVDDLDVRILLLLHAPVLQLIQQGLLDPLALVELHELTGARVHLRHHLHRDLLVEHVVEVGVGVVHDVLLAVLLAARVPKAHQHGDDHHQQQQVQHQDQVLVLLLQQEGGQPDGHLQRLLAVRVTVLLPVLLGRLVRQRLVRLGHLHKDLLSLLITRVLVRVVLETHHAVGFLDDFVIRSLINAQDLVRVK
mmetsp:Transcript_10339/g.20079  ORF Transcript_10339/g.20079 Transcript_10339/m.20079 type:complete len:525 (-) Transcript_10339:437-2011(-)